MGEAISFDRFLDLNYLDEADVFKIKDIDESTSKLLEEYKKIAINQIVQNFGLEKVLNIYKAGGNVTTLNNFNNKVFSDNESRRKSAQMEKNKIKLDRSTLDRNVTNKKGEIVSFNIENINLYGQKLVNEEINSIGEKSKVKADNPAIHEKKKPRKKIGVSAMDQINTIIARQKVEKGKIKDGYNHQQILDMNQNNKSKIHLDHTISLKNLSQNPAFNLFLSADEQSIFANSPNNLSFITASANQSKGADSITDWKYRGGKDNVKRFNKNLDDLNEKENLANSSLQSNIKKKKREYYSEKITKTSAVSGMKMGMKETLGLLLCDLQNEFSNEMKYYFANYKKYSKNKVKWEELKLCFSRIKDRVLNKSKRYLVEFSTGFLSGFLGNIMTVILNIFQTTYKRIVKLIGETFNGIVKSAKKMLAAENDENKYKEAAKIFSATLIGAIGGIMTESLIIYLRTTPFAVFSELIGATIGGILTGMTVASTMYMIDDFKGFIDSIKGIFTKDKYTQEELKYKFEELLQKIDEEYTFIVKRIKREYLKLNELTLKAYDTKISANERFTNTIVYASAMNVKESEIVNNIVEIEDFFLN